MSSGSAEPAPLTVGVSGDTSLVEAGVAGMLAGRPDIEVVVGAFGPSQRTHVGEGAPTQDVHGADPPAVARPSIDIALVDMVGGLETVEHTVVALVADPDVVEVALFALDFTATTIRAAERLGVGGFLTKSLGADALAEGLLAIGRGERVRPDPQGTDGPERAWAGRDEGLSEREGQVLALVAEGMTNREIADALFLGVETVRTHLKRAYQRLGVRNRAEAAARLRGIGVLSHAPPAPGPVSSRLNGSSALDPLFVDADAIADRLSLVGLDDDARRRLEALGPAARSQAHGFVQRLTARWLEHPETAELLRNPGVLERLQEHQQRYLTELFEGRFDEEHVAGMIRSGAVHHRIRLNPQWYVGSLAHIICDHLDLVWASSADDADAVDTLVGLIASVLFDATLVIDAYGSCVEREITAALTPPPGRSQVTAATSDPPKAATTRRPLARLGGAGGEASIRRRFVGLTEAHLDALSALGEVVESAMPRVLTEFYELLASSRALSDLVPTALVPRLMDQVALFWAETVAGTFDDAHAASRKRIGVVHERIGVGAQPYLAGLARQLAGILRGLPGSGVDVRAAAEALVRAAVFDATFVIDAYVEARAEALLQIGRFAAPVVAGLANGIAVVDGRNRVAYANEQLLGMVGIAAGVLHRLPVAAALPLESIDELVDDARDADERVSQVHDFRGRRVRVTAVALQRGVTGQEGLVAVVLDDITDIMATGIAVQREERRLDHLLESIDAVVWELDRVSLTVVAVSSASSRVFGLRDLDLLGRSRLVELVHPDDRVAFIAACRELGDEERTVVVHRIVVPGGAVVRMQSSLVGSRSPEGSATVSGVSVRFDVSSAVADEVAAATSR